MPAALKTPIDTEHHPRSVLVCVISAVVVLAGTVLPGDMAAAMSEPNQPTTAAPSADGDVSAQLYDSFYVHNLTGAPMTLSGVSTDGSNTGPWFDNDGLDPACSAEHFPTTADRFTLTYWFGWHNVALVTYKFGGSRCSEGSYVTLRAEVLGLRQTGFSCVAASADLSCETRGNMTTHLEAIIRWRNPGTIVIPASDGDDEREYREQMAHALCGRLDGAATCSYDPQGEYRTSYGPSKTVLESRIHNCQSSTPVVEDVIWLETETGSTSLGSAIAGGAKFFDAVKIGFELEYNQTWNWSRTFGETHSLEAYPGYTAWFQRRSAYIDVTGSLRATWGNATVVLEDVRVSAPPAADEVRGILSSHERKLTDDEWRTICRMEPPGPAATGAGIR